MFQHKKYEKNIVLKIILFVIVYLVSFNLLTRYSLLNPYHSIGGSLMISILIINILIPRILSKK